MKIENWCGYNIRFIEQDREWWAILKDICDALKLKTWHISERLDPDMLIKVNVSDLGSNEVRSRGQNKTRQMLAVNEIGIYEALYASRRLEARKFRRWSAEVMKKLRSNVGLEGYEVMKMTEPDIQEKIDNILDTIFYDPDTGIIMQSVTTLGGDVDQIPFE